MNKLSSADNRVEKGYSFQSKLFEKRIWRVADVAEYLGNSNGHIYNLCSRREIPFIKKGKQLYFIPMEIENWVLQGN